MKKLSLYILFTSIIILAILYYFKHKNEINKKNTTELIAMQISEIKKVAKLNVYELVYDQFINDNYEKNYLIAKIRYLIKISFDVEKLKFDRKKDSIIIRLPEAEIQIGESIKDGYTPIKAYKEQGAFMPNKEIEIKAVNIIKNRAKKSLVYELRKKGFIQRAHQKAKNSMELLFNNFDIPVRVI